MKIPSWTPQTIPGSQAPGMRASWSPNLSCRFLLEGRKGMEGLHTVSSDKKIERNNINLHRHSCPTWDSRTFGLALRSSEGKASSIWRDSFLAFPIHFPRPNYTKEVKNSDGSLKTVTTDKVEHLSCLSICCLASWPRTAPRSNLQRLDRWPESSGSEFAFYLMIGFQLEVQQSAVMYSEPP